jgi:hypothetical protein
MTPFSSRVLGFVNGQCLDRDGHTPDGVAHDGDQHDALRQSAAVHVTQSPRVLNGLFVPVCSCGTVGIPVHCANVALGWECFYREADGFAAAARRVVEQIEGAQQFGGVRR